ncbi:MAG: aminotransferase class I/II-fold pyridoxal phosphate-dependent enzyme [Candidatus Riflemargulisbacteria bacterium]
MDKQAVEINQVIQKSSTTVYELLGEKGKNAFFPKSGILSQSAQANGKKINATIGIATEDDGSPMRLDSLSDSIKLSPDKVFPYAPSYGRPDIRAKWYEHIYEKNPSLKDKPISLPVVTNALTHGLSIVGQMFFNQDEKLILPDLYWENYGLVFEQPFGIALDTCNTFKGEGFDIWALEEKISDNTVGKKAILLNFPNNPTGYTPTIEEVKSIVNLIKKSAKQGNKLLVILDDAYFGLVYKKNIYTESLFAELADLHENVLAIKIDGPTKEDYVWGFRVGFITYAIKGGDKDLYSAIEAKTAGLIRGNIYNSSNLSQSLLMTAYSCPNYTKEKQKKYELLKTRYEAVGKVLAEKKEYKKFFTALPFNSGYFMCVRLAKGIEGEALRKLLLDEFDTGVIWASGVMRIAFSAVPEKLIPELFENLYKACKKIVS